MAKKNDLKDNLLPLSQFGVLVAQLESIVASASQKPPEPLLCFDLLSDLISAISEEPKESILLWQRKCEDALYSLLVLGARRPVRHLASVAMARVISKGDSISIYSRASSLQGFLSDGKKSDPQKVAGAAQCLGELYRYFGRRITSGLRETTMIATKLFKFNEEFVRQEALHMLQNALEGSGGSAAASAYTEAFRLIMRFAVGDKSFLVRIAAARCLKAFAIIGGPGLGVGELDNSASFCVKALEDPVSSVRDAFAEALGSLLALGMNPDAQVQPRGKGPFPPAKKLEGGLQRHLALPFTKASGARSKDVQVGITLSWVFFLQAIRLKYLHPDSELQNYVIQVMDMLRADTSVDAYTLACVLYILRVGVTDQMTEPTQRSFLVFLGQQLMSPDASPSMIISGLRTVSYTLKTLGEVPVEFKEVLDNTVVAAVSHSSQLVRIEAALTLRALAEVDPTCVGGLISYGVTMLNALRENIAFEKGSTLQLDLDSLHGQATVLATLVSISPKLPLGYPARLPKSILEVSKKMLAESSRNPLAATIEKEAGWLLLSSLLASMPKEELEDQVFDILSLWVSLFTGNPQNETNQTGDLISRIRMWSAAIDALTSFLRCFLSHDAKNNRILLQPVLVYLSRALSYISLIAAKELPNVKPALNIFIIRTLIAYQSLPDPMAYKNEHPQIILICTSPFREAFGCEESSCLRFLLDKRDAWLGPWIPGRDWFEDELRAFQGGKDGLMPCVWENEVSSFPQPEPVNKTLVNQMLLCFGVMFASQDSGGMLSLLGMIEQSLKAGRKQPWHAASITNICVGLLSGFKALLSLRSQPLALDILNSAQAIFQSILAEGDICPSQRRAASECLGLLARLGNDIFTARMTRSLLSDLTGATDSNYAGSIAFALGCIHCSAGGMALSTLVPSTVSSISLLAKSSIAGLQIWSLHGLLLTIEAAGLSYVSQVQATLGLALDILLSEENGWVVLQQGVGRLINAIVAVLGPELSPGSIFFSRCKSVVSEISSGQETATMLESVRFTQQLVLFAPQAVSVHTHVQTLLPTLSSRQPVLRHLAVSTLRHLIEKDPVSVVDEQIEDKLFQMLDEETDSEIGDLVRTTIMRLLYASSPSRPSHWMSICRSVVLATSMRRNADAVNGLENDAAGTEGEPSLNSGEDDDNMVSGSKGTPQFIPSRDKHLRYRTRVFAAECLSYLPGAVGKNPAHFDLGLARDQSTNGRASGEWLVLHIQELIALAYQISTIQFENLQPIGVLLLSTIIDKFERTPDPELPGHLLLEQYQAQLVSAVRTALDSSSGPILLEAGFQLATKIFTSGIIEGHQIAVKRIYSLISRPLNDFKDLYYPSFAEWVSCKIKIRLLAAHASLKCHTYAFLRRHQTGVPDEYLALLPLFSKSSDILGKYWIRVLKDYSYICLCVHLKAKWNPFLDGIQSPLVSSKLQQCLEESWPVIMQAIALDAVPVNFEENEYSKPPNETTSKNCLLSGHSMVQLESEDYQFLWGFALLVLFQGQNSTPSGMKNPVSFVKAYNGGDPSSEELSSSGFKLYEIVLPVFQFLSTKRFANAGYLTMDICSELLQVFSYSMCMDNSWDTLSVSVLSQIVQNCPETFYESEKFAYLAMELCLTYLYKVFQSAEAISVDKSWEDLISSILVTAKTLVNCYQPKKQLVSAALAFLLIGYKGIREVSTGFCFSKLDEYFKCTSLLLKRYIDDICSVGDDGILQTRKILGTCLNVITNLTVDCIKCIQMLENKRSELHTLLQTKLAFSLEQTISFAKLAYQIDYLGDNTDRDSIYYGMFKYCTRCVQTVLTDSSLQVQEIGLLVLRHLIQKGTNVEDDTFLMLFVGELASDFFLIMQNMLKKPVTEKAASVAGECLGLLVLLQTSSKSSECQRGFMNLLLEAVLVVFKASEEGFSQEVNKLRSTAVRLVSHLAQVPSSAVHFKDVLLSMPPTHRQQFQGFIRASVTQEHNATQMKPTTPFLEIKLPVPAMVSKEMRPPAPATTSHSPVSDHQRDEEEKEDEDEDEDDWDAFQSFPATTSAAENDSRVDSALETPDPVENSSISEVNTESDQFHGDSVSRPLNNVEATSKADHQEAGKAEVISESPDDLTSSQGNILGHNVETEEPHDFQSFSGVIEVCDDWKERDDKMSGPEEGKGAGLNQDTEHRTSELHSIEDAQGLAGLNSTHHEQGKENTDNRPVQSSSDRVKHEEVKGAGSNQVTEHRPSEHHPVEEDAQGLAGLNSAQHEQVKESPENRPVQSSSDPVLDEEVKDKREDKEEPAREESKLQQHEESSKVQDLVKNKDDAEKSE
ncbi:PREDICTED: HEAT repeat-containing protein 5B isoform X1 [Fragaria vesca subsp. vesca]|uniref:HEAT repeat-containing protein 5B isoform X1 n=1 Tax=Fragaria vesca subsp. vesca TaxID=101020 RepID=UPI0002C349E7|nr:PREDICTED: HEAT repeat-containing protein 5B isoform X1 [Fragaria vesca subsp. vesca]